MIAALGWLLLASGWLAAPTQASLDTPAPGPCPDHRGVTVVVDFRSLGGGVQVRCAPGQPSSGFDALGRAGFSHRSTLRFPGFLCRIDDRPAADPCVDTPPATAYWSYWLAERNGRWCYSELGAANRRPPEGTVEGWSFATSPGGAAAAPPRAAVPTGPGPQASLGPTDCVSRVAAPWPDAPTTSRPPTSPPTASAAPPAPAPSATQSVGRPPASAAPSSAPTQGDPSEPAAGETTGGDPGAGGGPGPAAPSDPAEPSDAAAEVLGDTMEHVPTSVAGTVRADPARETQELAERAGALGSSNSSGSSPAGVLITGALLAALGAAAAVRRRRGAR